MPLNDTRKAKKYGLICHLVRAGWIKSNQISYYRFKCMKREISSYPLQVLDAGTSLKPPGFLLSFLEQFLLKLHYFLLIT